ncbi:hypothetical protein GLOIN_2v1537740 [Rhizophagus irregularis DAOM 181602=DAOM 197198]|nr:hypothetical protein GLOIN_2v1537740 [Rhizophagus irregularis DAOM 181602=DAOM 197198]
MRSDFSRLHSSSSQSLEMPGTESARSSRGGMEITSSINDVNSPGSLMKLMLSNWNKPQSTVYIYFYIP